MREQWKTHPEWPGYLVSDQGRVASFRKPGPGGGRRDSPNLLTPGISAGYFCVRLCRDDGTQKFCTVNRLVLEVFSGLRPSGYVARHLNDNKLDNRLSNLAWGTQRENVQDAIRSGLRPKAKRRRPVAALFPEEEYEAIAAIAEASGSSMSKLIVETVRKYVLANHEQEEEE